MRRFIQLPSPAMVVAAIALFVAMGGVSYGLASGSIDSREIKNGTVRGKDVRNGSLTGFDVKPGGIGGGSVNEGSLGTVPSAESHQPHRRGHRRRAARAREGRVQRGAHLDGPLPGDLQPRRSRLRLRGQRRRRQRRRAAGRHRFGHQPGRRT